MFAIIVSGGKQYRVQEGDVVRLEKLEADAGATVEFPVLVLAGDSVAVGTPRVEGAVVSGEVVHHGRGKKLHIRKFKAKANYRRHMGHRQPYTDVRITGIKA
ncbi:MAG: 50S ribosomal protein L21 [Trueperaceae bacterium]|nr:MAG: 50S ribosomal protein L21 [Trueperaceae bacterium]